MASETGTTTPPETAPPEEAAFTPPDWRDWSKLRPWLKQQLWSREPLRPAILGALRRVVQLTFITVEGFIRDQLLLRSHSLTYTTLLSLIPLLVLAGSLFKLLGGGEDVIRIIVSQLAAGAPDAVDTIIEYVEGMNFAALGTIGGAALMGTTIWTIGSVEGALNAIWGVTKQRPWVRRIPDYLAVLVVSPILLGVAISMRTTIESQWLVQKVLEVPALAAVWDMGIQHAPTVLMIAGFTFLYWFLPNTQVRWTSALLGGVVAGILFTLAQQLYVGANAQVTRWDLIFGSLAIIPLLMVWIYFSWAITLFGAEVAFAHQGIEHYQREVRGTPPGPAAREALGLSLATVIAGAFRSGEPPWSESELSERLDVPVRVVRDVLSELEAAGLTIPIADTANPGLHQLARPAASIQVADVLRALRGPRAVPHGLPGVAETVDAVFCDLETEHPGAASTLSLLDLVEGTTLPSR